MIWPRFRILMTVVSGIILLSVVNFHYVIPIVNLREDADRFSLGSLAVVMILPEIVIVGMGYGFCSCIYNWLMGREREGLD